MPYFSSLANFIATVTARFNKPRRSLTNAGLLKQDIIDALTDSAKYADDAKTYTDALNASFIYRSMNLVQAIYVDGVNGNDARLGTTNDANAITGCVKTLARVEALHSGKTGKLVINIVGNLTHASDVTLDIPEVYIQNSVAFTISKKSLGAAGEGSYQVRFKSSHVYVYNSGGTINLEAHAAPPASPTEFNYWIAQGAFCLSKNNYWEYEAPKYQIINVMGGTINVGNYCTLVTTGRNGGETNSMAKYHSPGGSIGTTVNLGTGSVLHDLIGDRVALRQYHPTSNADTNVAWGETVLSPTTEQVFTRRAGTTHLIHALRRYHPTSSTDANVWEGEMVISTSNNDLYYKNNGTIRRVTTAVYS